MNGQSVLVDTNLFIYLLKGYQTAAELLDGKDIYVSFITEIELLSFKKLSSSDESQIINILKSAQVIHSNSVISRKSASLRKTYGLSLPDAIIAASAVCLELPLITADKKIQKVAGLE